MVEAALVLEDRAVLREGKANDLVYIAAEIKPLATLLNESPPEDLPEEANRDSIFLDHGDGTLTWVGHATNFRWDDETKSLRADLHIADEDIANKISYQEAEGRSRFGISPRLIVRNDKGTARDIKVRSFSLVINPAGGQDLMLSSGERVVKIDAAKRIVLGPVLVPDKFDLQDESINAEEIEKTAHQFMADLVYGVTKPGEMHRKFDSDIRVVESYVMPCDGIINGKPVGAGTWMMAVHIRDDDVWNKVVKGHYCGFSVGGLARKVPVE